MRKKTGEEPITSLYSESSGPVHGMPIRLQIAAMILQGLVSNGPLAKSHNDARTNDEKYDVLGRYASQALNLADTLVESYNNTPNPNSKN